MDDIYNLKETARHLELLKIEKKIMDDPPMDPIARQSTAEQEQNKQIKSLK